MFIVAEDSGGFKIILNMKGNSFPPTPPGSNAMYSG